MALEATGPYGDGLAQAAFAAGCHVVLLNPRRVADFARSSGRRNKTDRVDAEIIARFVLSQPEAKLPRWQPLPPPQAALQALLRRQADLELQLHGEQRRLEVAAPTVAASLRRSLRWLEAELQRLEKTVQAHLRAHPELAADVARLQAIGGIGEKTARLLTAELPRHFRNARAVAAWLGVIPRRVQSGTSVRQAAHVGHEAPALRSKLYFPALTAMRCDPRCQAFAQRLRAAGKPPKSVILAVLHKLIRSAFALLKNHATYEPDPRPPATLRRSRLFPLEEGFGETWFPMRSRPRVSACSSYPPPTSKLFQITNLTTRYLLSNGPPGLFSAKDPAACAHWLLSGGPRGLAGLRRALGRLLRACGVARRGGARATCSEVDRLSPSRHAKDALGAAALRRALGPILGGIPWLAGAGYFPTALRACLAGPFYRAFFRRASF